jgi:GTPase SAR1 family protein
MLVGTKFDAAQEQATGHETGERPITEQELEAAAKEIGASGSVVCSALTQHQLRLVFETAVQIVNRDNNTRK